MKRESLILLLILFTSVALISTTLLVNSFEKNSEDLANKIRSHGFFQENFNVSQSPDIDNFSSEIFRPKMYSETEKNANLSSPQSFSKLLPQHDFQIFANNGDENSRMSQKQAENSGKKLEIDIEKTPENIKIETEIKKSTENQEELYEKNEKSEQKTEKSEIDSENIANDQQDMPAFIDQDFNYEIQSIDQIKKNFLRLVPNITLLFDLFSRDLVKFQTEPSENSLSSSKLVKERTVLSEEVLCKPKFYGFTNEQVSEISKKRDFFQCPKNSLIQDINTEKNLIRIECPQSKRGSYLVGTRPDEELVGTIEYSLDMNAFSGQTEVNFENSEFFMAKCGYNPKQAYLRNKFSEKSAKRASDIQEKIKRQLNLTSTKPLGVYVLMIDSLSRYLFYRSFKETLEYLDEVLKSPSNPLQIYDFLVNNPHGVNTRPNLVPFLYGRSLENHSKIKKGLDYSQENSNVYELIQEGSLWKFYEKLGFVTLLGYDTIWDFFPDDSGRKVFTDHNIFNFWRAAKKVFGYNDFVSRQMCIGDKFSHRYILDYINEYANNYKGNNRFAYHHISTGHENSMNKIKTLDRDMKEFLQRFIEIHQKNDEDFVLFICADHGLIITPLKYLETVFENRSPVHLIITNKGFVGKIGKNADENLRHNTERLVSRYDWHMTLKHIALLAYGNIEKHSETYDFLMENYEKRRAYSLLAEKIHDDRTCDDAGIPEYMCICREFQDISLYSSFFQFVLTGVIEKTIEFMNNNFIDGEICKKIVKGNVLEAKEYVIHENNLKFLMVVIENKDYSNVKLEFVVIVEKYSPKKQKIGETKIRYPTYRYHDTYNDEHFRIYTDRVFRRDNDDCNLVARENLIKHDYCICEDDLN